jgi:2-polyprenyl-3-methyl-5-hydroxy-6-metoxy-1,4-benzoquinol methylase
VPRLLTDLTSRVRQPELMDEPDLDRAEHFAALKGLARINVLSLVSRETTKRLLELPAPAGKPYRVLDVACGGGDVAVSIKRWAERQGVAVQIEGWDISPAALDFARLRAEERGVEVAFHQVDVTRGTLRGDFDLVYSSLFLHHLSDEGAAGFLKGLTRLGRAVLVHDLLRTRLGYLLAFLAGRVLTRSPVVRVDGPRSVRAAFSLEEVRDLASRATMKEARVEPCWPERFALFWKAP